MRTVFLEALHKKILTHAHLVAIKDQKLTKDQVAAIEKRESLTGEQRKLYDLFVEHESVPMLKLWVEQQVSLKWDEIQRTISEARPKKTAVEKGITSLIGSWFRPSAATNKKDSLLESDEIQAMT